ncbi:delta-endotoxin CytB [Schizophyllum fasciatum]
MVSTNAPPIGDPRYFQPLYKLPDALETASDQINKFASEYVSVFTEFKEFEWFEFKEAVGSYSGNDLLGSTPKEAVVTLEEPLDYMIDLLASLMGHLPHGIDVQEVKDAARAAFTDLRAAQENGWADFHTPPASPDTYWKYRLLLAAPSQDLDDAVSAVVVTVRFMADIEKESDWYTLTGDTVHNYTIYPITMRLIAKKDDIGLSGASQ